MTPRPPPSAITGSTVVEPFLSVVVVQPFAVYEDPGSVSAVSPGGIEVIVLDTARRDPAEFEVAVDVVPAWG